MQIKCELGSYLFDNRTAILTSNNRCNNYYYVDQTQRLDRTLTDLLNGLRGQLNGGQKFCLDMVAANVGRCREWLSDALNLETTTIGFVATDGDVVPRDRRNVVGICLGLFANTDSHAGSAVRSYR